MVAESSPLLHANARTRELVLFLPAAMTTMLLWFPLLHRVLDVVLPSTETEVTWLGDSELTDPILWLLIRTSGPLDPLLEGLTPVP